MASKFLMNQAIQDANAIDQSAGIPATGRGVPRSMQQYFSGTNPGAYGSGDWRSNMNQSYNWPDSGARYEYNRPYNMSDVAGQVGEYGQVPGQGNNEMMYQAPKKNIFSRFTTPLMQILQSQRNNPEEVFGLKNFPTNNGRVNYHPNDSLYAGMNVATGFGKGLSGAGEKRIGRIEDTIAGFADQWGNLKESDEAAYNKKLAFHQDKLKRFKAEQAAYQADLALQTGQGGTKVDPPATTGTATYGGPPTKSWDPVQHAKSGGGHYKGAGTSGSYAAGPQGGAGYGPWSKRDGGRIGYAGGELVEQETDFIQGPQGGEEFQETVVEGQDQPSREQLEALAMEIFQLPLEELDEQQLLVVYQEAMQGQPMEEAVQEEDVQFAAQGGLAGLL